MQNNFAQILQTLHISVDDSCLKELYCSFQFAENNCCFLFNIKSNKYCYLCPSIKQILGYNHQKFEKEGFLFLKEIINPHDFSVLLTEIITLVKITDKINGKYYNVNGKSLPFRIRHKDGRWIKLMIHIKCIKNVSDKNINLLIGFIEKKFAINSLSFIDDFKITSREKEVLEYLAGGNSAKKIASKLFISESTVITHRKHLIQKLKVKNSAELIKKSFELHLLN